MVYTEISMTTIKEEKVNRSDYLQKLSKIRGDWLSVKELAKTREKIAKMTNRLD